VLLLITFLLNIVF